MIATRPRTHRCPPHTHQPRPLALPTHEPNRSAAPRNRPPSIRLSKVDSKRSFACGADSRAISSHSWTQSLVHFLSTSHFALFFCDAALALPSLAPPRSSSGVQQLSREPATNPAAASGALRSRNALQSGRLHPHPRQWQARRSRASTMVLAVHSHDSLLDDFGRVSRASLVATPESRLT